MSIKTLFQVGGPVTKEYFYDREEILDELEMNLVRKRSVLGYALYGARRTGKTSILREFIERRRENKDIIMAYVDVSGVYPFKIENFYDAIFSSTIEAFKEKGTLPLKVSARELLKGSVSNIVALIKDTRISFTVREYLELKLSFKEGKINLQELLDKAFTAIEKLSKQTKTRGILLLDEFPFVEGLDKDISWAVRSIVQNWKRACIIIAGSNVSMMRQMTSIKTSPFYMLLQIREIGPFSEEISSSMIKDKFKEAGVKIDASALKEIYTLTRGFPFYLQWLGNKIYDLCVFGDLKNVDSEIVKKAYEKILREGEIIFSADLEKLSIWEKNILVEIAKSKSKNISSIAKGLDKRMDIVGKMVERLIEKGYLKKIGSGIYEFTDPLLKEWINFKY